MTLSGVQRRCEPVLNASWFYTSSKDKDDDEEKNKSVAALKSCVCRGGHDVAEVPSNEQ